MIYRNQEIRQELEVGFCQGNPIHENELDLPTVKLIIERVISRAHELGGFRDADPPLGLPSFGSKSSIGLPKELVRAINDEIIGVEYELGIEVTLGLHGYQILADNLAILLDRCGFFISEQ